MDDELARRLIDAMNRDPARLAVLAGAGLSRAAPSELPSAAEVAELCFRRYQSEVGEPLPPEAEADLGLLASEVWEREQFPSPFLQDIVPWDVFHGTPNPGHFTIADMLICGALDFVATTNYDRLVEDAAQSLNRPSMEGGLDGREVEEIGQRRHKPYLKLHGCCWKNRRDTLWCEGQLEVPPYSDRRIPTTTDWLRGRLEYRHLIIVGFWTDWSYLNALFDSCLYESTLTDDVLVTVVDPKPLEELCEDAPDLWSWIEEQEGVEFHHEPVSGAEFLDELRALFSRRFLVRAIARGTGGTTVWELPEGLSTKELYGLRGDFTGQPHSEPVTKKTPEHAEGRVGEMHVQLIEAGAELNGFVYRIGEYDVRLVNAAGYRLSVIRELYSEELGSPVSVDLIVCVGGQSDPSPPNFMAVREEEANVVTAGQECRWLTDREFVDWMEERGI